MLGGGGDQSGVRKTSLTLVSHPRREKGLLDLTPSTVWRALEL